MVDRLEQLLKKKHLSPAQLADEIGVQRSGIYHIMKGRNKPGMDFLQKLLTHFPDVNPGWLMIGKGPMFSEQKTNMVEEPAIGNQNNPLPTTTEESISLKRLSENKEYPKLKKTGANRNLRNIEKIVVFYDDHTFTEYYPNEKPV